MEVKDRFLNFPIVLLRGFLEDHRACIATIIQYSVYEMVYSNAARFESLDEFMEEYEFTIPQDFIPSIGKQGKELFDSCYGMNYPRVGIHIDTLMRFNKDRTQFDLVCLLLFLALKSIVQTKPFCNAKNAILHSRMAGFPKSEKIIPESITYWMKCESRRRKVFTEVEKHYKVVRAYKAQGTTFSINKLTQEELEFRILMKREEKEDLQSSLKKRQAKNEAKRKLEEWKKRKKKGDDDKKGDDEPDNTNT